MHTRIPLILLVIADSHVFVLTKNMQTTDLEHERFLRGRVQVVAHFFEVPDSLQYLRGIQLRRNFCRRFRAAFE